MNRLLHKIFVYIFNEISTFALRELEDVEIL